MIQRAVPSLPLSLVRLQSYHEACHRSFDSQALPSTEVFTDFKYVQSVKFIFSSALYAFFSLLGDKIVHTWRIRECRLGTTQI